jgi:hypothetical protein
MLCQCDQLRELRNTLMESVLDVLSVERSVEFCNQDEGPILEGLLGGTSNMLATIESDVWERFMRVSALHIYKFKPFFPILLF